MKMILENINQVYGTVVAVSGFNIDIREGEMIALLGPSGCGKTTLLKTIAGLMPLQKGKIKMDGIDISDWSAQKRNTAMVFQNYALFPHMTVFENISYGLKIRKLKKQEIRKKVDEVLKVIDLLGLENRMIHELSGGQQQRVALARALVIEPSVMLFDEPLSNLDEKLRVAMRQEIKRIQREFGITCIYVTHDQAESLSIADRIVVMDKGEIQQIGTSHEVYFKPKNKFVAEFMGEANLFEINELNKIKEFRKSLKESSEFSKVMFRPESIVIEESGGIEAEVKWVENLGGLQRLTLKSGKFEFIADILNKPQIFEKYKIGSKVGFNIDYNDFHYLK